jgi:hypothetical protein
MRDLLDRIVARYPYVAQRCCELAARWVAEEAVALKEGQALLRGKDDILPGLAQAMRESGVDLAEMARECGIDPIELRRKIALSRFGELLRPGEFWSSTDQELESKLQQAAREYSLEMEQLLNEISGPSAITPGTGAALPVRSRAVRIAWLLRCWMCRKLRPQRYRIDFTPCLLGEIRFLSEPAYACHRCLPTHLVDQQVQQITRLTDSEIPKSPGVKIWSGAFAAVVIVAFSSLYVRGSGAARETTRVPMPPTTAAAQLATEIEPVSRAAPLPAEPNQEDEDAPAAAPVLTQVAPVSTFVAPSAMASGSQDSGRVIGKQHEIAAPSVVTPPSVVRADGSQRLHDQSGRQASDRATALNNCREILRDERPLMRYSIRDTVQDADQEAVSVAEACARTVTSLTQRGNECAGLFNWFEVFQTRLTKHVNRACREAVRKGTTP